MPVFEINVDASPVIRFAEVNSYFKASFADLASTMVKMFQVPHIVIDQIYNLQLVDRETDEEILAASSMLLPNPDQANSDQKHKAYEQLLVINMLYEFTATCTSMCVRNKDGNVIHARNFDLFLPNMISKVTYRARFFKYDKDESGAQIKKYQMEAVMFAGLSGAFTVMNPGAFSITIDSRLADTSQKIMNFLALDPYLRGLLSSSMLMRRTAERAKTYEEAVAFIKRTSVTSTAYFAICGVKDNQGTVIFKKMSGSNSLGSNSFAIRDELLLGYNDGPTSLNLDEPNPLYSKQLTAAAPDYEVLSELSNDKWYLIIGNDHTYESGVELKVAEAMKVLDKLKTQENAASTSILPTDLLEVLSTPLVFNRIFIYAVVMSAGGLNFCDQASSSPIHPDYCEMKTEMNYLNGIMSGLRK